MKSDDVSSRRRNQIKNRPTIFNYTITPKQVLSIPNSTLIRNLANDRFSPATQLIGFKFVFLGGLSFLVLLSIILLLFISKCLRGNTEKIQRPEPDDRKSFHSVPNYDYDQYITLLEQNGDGTISSNSIASNDSTLEKVLMDIPLTSLHSQRISPTNSIGTSNDSSVVGINDDIFSDADFENILSRPITISYNKPANPPIRESIETAEEKARHILHGSHTNIYIKSIREQKAADQKEHINAKRSSDLETSEDESY